MHKRNTSRFTRGSCSPRVLLYVSSKKKIQIPSICSLGLTTTEECDVNYKPQFCAKKKSNLQSILQRNAEGVTIEVFIMLRNLRTIIKSLYGYFFVFNSVENR